jgi:hypothetical protein
MAAEAHGQTSAERLGYPAGARVVILYASEMGAAYEFSRPGQQLLASGAVQSCGVLAPGPWFDEFADWCRRNPAHDVGVSLTLTCPSTIYRWQPVSPRSRVSSLVDADGFFWHSLVQVALQADADEVRHEFEEQIRRVQRAGIRPTHLAPHLGTVLARPDLLKVYLDLAEKYWLPAVMVELNARNIERFRNEGFPLTEDFVKIVADYPLPLLDDAQFVADAASYAEKQAMFFEQMRKLTPGITQCFLQPAEQTPGLELLSARWQNRVWEARLVSDETTQRFLRENGIVLTNWREIMQRFEGASSGRASQE